MTACLLVALWLLPAAQPGSDALFLTLQRAAARDDRPAVAALMAFPLNVTAGSVRLPIPDAAAFLANYDAIMTPALTAILSDPDMRGRFVTVAPAGGAWKVTEIRVPLDPVEAAAAKPSGAPARAGGRGAAPEPRRIAPRAGGAPTELAGALRAAETASYVFTGSRGQLLAVRVDRVRGRLVLARIVDRRSGAPLDARAGEGVRAWSGRLPADGDYLIDVRRMAGDEAATLPYTLVVSLR